MRKLTVALLGNPNSGKTTLFNHLTGSTQYVGNRPGVTVEKKEGRIKNANSYGFEATLVDLPGIYSLSPYSLEEVIAREYVINEKPNVVINIVDATNIERNLYLTLQLMEMEVPLVVALNMMDEVKRRGYTIDVETLAKELNIRVIPITAKTGEGLQELLQAVGEAVTYGGVAPPYGLYDSYTKSVHRKIENEVWKFAVGRNIPLGWASKKLLEGDKLLLKTLNLPEGICKDVDKIVKEFERSSKYGDRETIIADFRYRFIENVVKKAVNKEEYKKIRRFGDTIDSIVTHRVLALPIFFLVMFTVFYLTFGSVGAYLQDGVENLVDKLSYFVEKGLLALYAKKWIVSLIVDGVILGVGGVLSFLPQIAILFFLLSIIEDTGYMSRIAFITDRLLRRFGLSGKAFIPMLMGFGCTVPAVMAARTMENIKDKRLTILLIPFMSCSAKLPIYGFLAHAFFEEYSVLVVFSLYILGILLGIVSGVFLKNTLFKDNDAPFVMELPPYRIPSLMNTMRHVWEKVEHFIKKAATLIFTMTVVIWFLQSFNFKLQYVEDGNSMLGAVGKVIAVVFKPLGFGTWQATVALLTGLIAKEAVVSTLSMLYGITQSNGGNVGLALSSTFQTPLAAYSFLVFTLLYVPCVAAFSTMRKELHSTKWAVFSALYQIGVAYFVAFLVYNIGNLFLT